MDTKELTEKLERAAKLMRRWKQIVDSPTPAEQEVIAAVNSLAEELAPELNPILDALIVAGWLNVTTFDGENTRGIYTPELNCALPWLGWTLRIDLRKASEETMGT